MTTNTSCYLCGRAIGNYQEIGPLAFPICERARCRYTRDVHEGQFRRIREYHEPIYVRYLERAEREAEEV